MAEVWIGGLRWPFTSVPGSNYITSLYEVEKWRKDGFHDFERDAWAFWNGLSGLEREIWMRTVRSELERLLLSIDNWLPAGARRLPDGSLEIVIRIFPEEVGAGLGLLDQNEKEDVVEAIQGLSKMLEEDDE